jgi:hypothetical protein
MLHPDPRAYRVALVADAVVNEQVVAFDALAALEAHHFGIIVLPPSDFTLPSIGSIVEYVIDDLTDYERNGYRVVEIGSSALAGFGTWRNVVAAELERRGHVGFERFDVTDATRAEFEAFLAAPWPPALAR